MPLTDATLNGILDGSIAFTTDAVRMSLHSADPGVDGSNETTAGRQTFAWNAPATGDTDLTGAVSFSGGTPSGACTHVGIWTADDLTFLGGFALIGATTFDSNGDYIVTSGALAGSSTG